MAFHPLLPRAYVISELNPTITTYSVDPKTGTLTSQLSTFNLTPTTTPSHPAEIAVADTGKYIYASIRGEDTFLTIALSRSGVPESVVTRYKLNGSWPRHFKVTGKSQGKDLVMVALQNSGSVEAVEVDNKGGVKSVGGVPQGVEGVQAVAGFIHLFIPFSVLL
ncbi:hypothetical protein HK104_000459 [Borealophlyctis nickersoniae]|nr:hypothetical protein HK104_000459 [Borealophlyctis nickersoniae]